MYLSSEGITSLLRILHFLILIFFFLTKISHYSETCISISGLLFSSPLSSKVIRKGEVSCCWTCTPCKENEYVFDEYTCRACELGSWPTDDLTGEALDLIDVINLICIMNAIKQRKLNSCIWHTVQY